MYQITHQTSRSKSFILSFLFLSIITTSLFSQAPQAFKYQGILRDGSGVEISNQNVGVQFSIIQNNPAGPIVYTETHTAVTNEFGLTNLEIGRGTTIDNFSNIDWANGPYFIQVGVDPNGGNNYTVIQGTSELLSVPYALHAGSTSSSGFWTQIGNNISNNNPGNVGVGYSQLHHNFGVANVDGGKAVIGHIGNFNETLSGSLVFSEDASYSDGDCGIGFFHNGNMNKVFVIGGCTTFADTSAAFTRNGGTIIRNLKLTENMTESFSNSLSLDVFGESRFSSGDVEINGNLIVTGMVSKGGGTFMVDHPIDPENKYLIHSFVESPEMLNVFSGNITTDASGLATVELPQYFEAANKDFRYQLTVIGEFAQAIIKSKIKNNSFIIQTDKPNLEVSWQVTGVRSDKFAEAHRIVPEKEKEIKGKYLHPELYGKKDGSIMQAMAELKESSNGQNQRKDADSNP